MKSHGLSDIRKELMELQPRDLIELCLKLAKFKTDNKELLGYLLFDAHGPREFLQKLKEETDQHFENLKTQNNLYYVKKSLRKIQRLINKYCKYMSDDSLTAELHIYFLLKLKESGIPFTKSEKIMNIYRQEMIKINALITSLHEDLRADYQSDLEKLAL
jgi:ferritin-like protein